jgi:hypothetical protein
MKSAVDGGVGGGNPAGEILLLELFYQKIKGVML